MRSLQRKYRSPAVSRHPPITPGASGSKTRNAGQVPRRASATPRSSFPRPSSTSSRQMRTPYQTTDTTNEAEQYDCDDDDLGHVIAAIDMKDYGTVGCAYYSAEEEKLYLLGDSRSGGMEAIDACKSYLLDASFAITDSSNSDPPNQTYNHPDTLPSRDPQCTGPRAEFGTRQWYRLLVQCKK